MKRINGAPYSTGAFTEGFAGFCLIAATAAETLCVCSAGFLFLPPRRFFLAATGGATWTTHSDSDSSLASRPYESSYEKLLPRKPKV